MARSAPRLCLAFVLACAFLPVAPAQAASKSFVQARSAAVPESASSATVAFKRANGAGNLLVTLVVWDGGGSVSVSDSAGNGWGVAAGPTTAGGGPTQSQVFFAGNAAGGANTVTASFSNAQQHASVYIHEYAGVSRRAPFDAAVSASGTSPDLDSGPVPTHASGQLLFAAIATTGKSVKRPSAGFHARGHGPGVLTADAFGGDAGSEDLTALQSGDAWAVQLVAFSYSGIAPRGSPAFPLRDGPGSPARYLVDQNGKPFLIQGDSPQSLFVNLTEKEAAGFFADRAKGGFNVLWINLLCGTYTGGRPDGSTIDGILPFQDGFFNTPNEEYFARVDRMIRTAAQRGITILLDPAETGYFLITTSILTDIGDDSAENWGNYVGQRYRGFDNVLWLSGNDFQDYTNGAKDAAVQAVVQGIRDVDEGHIHTVQLNFLQSGSLDDPSWGPLIRLNASYTYFPTYAEVLKDYNRNAMPTFLVEANYDFEHEAGTTDPPVSNTAILRRQAYWALTSGATGQMYGNGFTWPFLKGWQRHLDTPGSKQMGFVSRLFAPRRWFDLVPDQGHALVTGGLGTFSDGDSVGGNDYVTAARTPDGALAIAYLPAGNAITVDLTQMSGTVKASWYDPSRGGFAKIRGSPFPNTNGAQPLQPPPRNGAGDADWVLVLEVAP